jgi:hypothetical protein
MRVLFLSQATPGPMSGGGPRRSHQLWHELNECFGAENVVLASASEFVLPYAVPSGRFQKLFSMVSAKFSGRWKRASLFEGPRSAAVIQNYRCLVESAKPDAVLLESADVHYLAEINNDYGLKTVSAPWSIEALTNKLVHLITAFRRPVCDTELRGRVVDAFRHFAEDLLSGAKCEKIWALSRLECGFLKSAGLRCDYLPYYPVGDAELYLERIRVHRTPKLGQFVICGGSITQNAVGLQHFLQKLAPADIPVGAKIIVSGVSELPSEWIAHLEGTVEFCGRLSEEDFSVLMANAHAVIIPQNCGFGCMTRVADSLRAGIPVLADAIVGNGTGEVPGLSLVDDYPDGWSAALHNAMAHPDRQYFELFSNWHSSQRVLLRTEISKMQRGFY